MTDESRDCFQACYRFSPWKRAARYQRLEQSKALRVGGDRSVVGQGSQRKAEPPGTNPTSGLGAPPAPPRQRRRGGRWGAGCRLCRRSVGGVKSWTRAQIKIPDFLFSWQKDVRDAQGEQ